MIPHPAQTWGNGGQSREKVLGSDFVEKFEFSKRSGEKLNSGDKHWRCGWFFFDNCQHAIISQRKRNWWLGIKGKKRSTAPRCIHTHIRTQTTADAKTHPCTRAGLICPTRTRTLTFLQASNRAMFTKATKNIVQTRHKDARTQPSHRPGKMFAHLLPSLPVQPSSLVVFMKNPAQRTRRTFQSNSCCRRPSREG